jgi:hypothetical protein
VISLSSRTNKGPPESSPCDHPRDPRRYIATPSSCGVPFNTAHAYLPDTAPAEAYAPAEPDFLDDFAVAA